MKIISLHVVAFGKLKNVNLQFNSGINVLQQVNSFGKTTMAAFIRAMLYGFTYTHKKGVTDASHFAPWGSADKFGGSLVVEHDNTHYRIERFFGSTAKQENVSITNEKTGKALDWNKQPGEMLLGLTAESYDRSAYFPQEAVTLEPNENLDSRLANLVQDGAEDYDKVQEKLRAYKKNLRYERGSGGEIYELEGKKRQLEEQLNNAQNSEKRAAEIDKRLSEIAQERTALERRHAECQEQLAKLQAQTPVAENSQPPQSRIKNNVLLKILAALFAVVGIVLIVLGLMGVCSKSVGLFVGGACCVMGGVMTCDLYLASKRLKNTQQNVGEQSALNRKDELVEQYLMDARKYVYAMSELATETGRLTEERKILTFNSVELMDKLLTVEQERKDALHRYEVADTVVKLLTQAKDNLSSSYLPRLCLRCSQLLQDITQKDFSVVVDRTFTVSLRENGQTKPISEFSRGIREITLLCFRIALSELLYDGAIPFIIIDDAFVNFDEANFLRATMLLKTLSAHAQVIYFTCHDRTGNLLKN